MNIYYKIYPFFLQATGGLKELNSEWIYGTAKFYVVFIVILVILFGILGFLIFLENRLSKIDRQIKE